MGDYKAIYSLVKLAVGEPTLRPWFMHVIVFLNEQFPISVRPIVTLKGENSYVRLIGRHVDDPKRPGEQTKEAGIASTWICAHRGSFRFGCVDVPLCFSGYSSSICLRRWHG